MLNRGVSAGVAELRRKQRLPPLRLSRNILIIGDFFAGEKLKQPQSYNSLTKCVKSATSAFSSDLRSFWRIWPSKIVHVPAVAPCSESGSDIMSSD